MADEEKIIFSISVDNAEAIKAVEEQTDKITELTVANERLRKEQKTLDTSTKEGLEERKRLGQQIEKNNQQLKDEKQERTRLTKVVKTNSNSLAALRQENAKLNKERANVDTSTKEGQKRFADLTKEIKKNKDAINEAEQAAGNFTGSVGNYSTALDGFNGATGGAIGGLKGMTKAAIAFIATPIGAVLGAIVVVVKAVKAAFTSSEEGQNKWNKIMSVAGAIIGNFNDLLADFGEKVISVFENPQQALKDFAELLKRNIINRVQGMLELFPALGKAISLVFKGEFKEASKVATDAVGKVVLGVENVTDKIKEATEATKEFIKEQQREGAEAAKVADMRAKADKIERNLLIERAKLESQIAELRLKGREEDEYTAAQRKQFLTEARDLQDGLLEKEKEVLELRRDAQILENTFSRTDIENKNKEAEAIAAVSRKEAERFNQARQIQRELTTISKQLRAEQEAQLKFAESAIDSIDAYFDKEADLVDDSVDKFVDSELKKTQTLEAENEKRAQAFANYAIGASNAFAAWLNGDKAALKEYGKFLANQLIDTITATLIAENVKILIQSLAQPDSVATFGTSGLARAALITGITIPAAAGAKALLNKFADGGEVKTGMFTGASHAGGGVTLSADGVPIAEVEGGERFFVVNKRDSATISNLSAINSQHGNAFSTPVRFAQDGGEISTQAVTAQQVVDIIQQTPIFVKVTDINTGQAIRTQVIQGGTV